MLIGCCNRSYWPRQLTPHQKKEAIKRCDTGQETLAEIGLSYNVLGGRWRGYEHMTFSNPLTRITETFEGFVPLRAAFTAIAAVKSVSRRVSQT